MSKRKDSLLSQGQIINDTYTVKYYLEEGNFSEIYLVEHNFMGLQVMKVFKHDYVINTDIDILMHEAKILSDLYHENIVRLFEANRFISGSKLFYYLTFNHISGESLNKLLRRKIKLPFELAYSLQIDLLKALSYVHSLKKPIVHRDINLDNFLISYEDKPIGKLVDFGLAQSLSQINKITKSAGRYLYFAPECFWGNHLPSSDVFSAGIVFYKMLTGVFPWNLSVQIDSINSSEEIANAIQLSRKNEVTPPSYFNSTIPTSINDVLFKSLESSIENRYLDASGFLNDLLNIN